jgi:hypothetical protein
LPVKRHRAGLNSLQQAIKYDDPFMKRALTFLALSLWAIGDGPAQTETPSSTAKPGTSGLVPLVLKFPEASAVGTPKDLPAEADIEPPSKTPPPPLMVPADVKNVAPGSKITCSDSNAGPTDLAKLTDGIKEAIDENVVLLRKGVQWVQFDLGGEREIFALAIWHAYDTPKAYRGVIAQVADDAGFTAHVRTLFNNDTDNGTKLGAGTDRRYFETNLGKIIDAKGVKARYVRLYSHGSTDSPLNEYTEVEIYGRAVK